MSVLTVTAVETAGETLTGAIGDIAASAQAALASAWPVAAIVAAVEVGKLFGKFWNKDRDKIDDILSKVSGVIKATTDAGVILNAAQAKYKTFINTPDQTRKLELINAFLNNDYGKLLSNLNDGLTDISQKAFAQVTQWTTTEALMFVAQTDNTFYTENRNDIDALINTYVAKDVQADSLTRLMTKSSELLNALIDDFDRLWTTTVTVLNDITDLYHGIPNEAARIRATVDGVRTRPITVESLTGTVPSYETLTAEMAKILDHSAVLTKTKTVEESLKLKRKKLRIPRKKKKQQKKSRIRYIYVNVANDSNWIEELEFKFPRSEPINSDARGTMTFKLKKGKQIKKVRVNRGTFSVITMYSLGTKFGVGYRYWSQFNKKNIVNKGKVISWFIPRINAEDRELAIPLEILEKKVKYK